MTGYAKLDAGIVESSLWMQPHDVLRVWVAMMAKCDAFGIVRVSVPSMAHLCRVSVKRLEAILEYLTAPDPYSRSPDDEGRRLRAIEGGWVLVNYVKCREVGQEKAGSHAGRQAKYRARLKERDAKVTPVTGRVTRDTEAEAEAEAEKKKLQASPVEVAEPTSTDQPHPADPIPGEPATSNIRKHPAAERLAETVLGVYHETLPSCQRIAVLNPKRLKRVQEADKLARKVCRDQGWDYDAATFWRAYFARCAEDPWLRGDVPNPKNPRWKQNLDVLLREDRFAEVMDTAIAAMREEAA